MVYVATKMMESASDASKQYQVIIEIENGI